MWPRRPHRVVLWGLRAVRIAAGRGERGARVHGETLRFTTPVGSPSPSSAAALDRPSRGVRTAAALLRDLREGNGVGEAATLRVEAGWG
jgi:hypothetical protein